MPSEAKSHFVWLRDAPDQTPDPKVNGEILHREELIHLIRLINTSFWPGQPIPT